MSDDVTGTLAAVAAGLPGGGESRPGQQDDGRGGGTGHRRPDVTWWSRPARAPASPWPTSIPAALSGERVVVATATKALQDQLAHNDLPLVAAAVDGGFSFAVLKGRSNYLCRQRVAEIGGRGEQMTLQPGSADPPDADDPLTPAATDEPTAPDDPAEVGRLGDQVRRLVRWADDTTTGDRAELEFEPHFRAWAMVSTTARECPGAFRCPSGRDCFAEAARARAAEADVVVVNTHLYGAHLASGGAVLPPHQVVVFDEAHEVEEVMTDSLGVEIGPGRFRALAATARPLLDAGVVGSPRHRRRGGRRRRPVPPGPPAPGRPPDRRTADPGGAAADGTGRPAAPMPGGGRASRWDWSSGWTSRSPPPGPGPETRRSHPRATRTLHQVVALATGRVGRLIDHLRRGGTAGRGRRVGGRTVTPGPGAAGRRPPGRRPGPAGPRSTDDEVAWVDGGARSPSLRVSPIDVGAAPVRAAVGRR